MAWRSEREDNVQGLGVLQCEAIGVNSSYSSSSSSAISGKLVVECLLLNLALVVLFESNLGLCLFRFVKILSEPFVG